MADPLAPDDRDLRAELRRATSTLPGTGGDFADLTRRVRRRRASQAAMRAGIPALCVVVLGGGLFALGRRGTDADRPAATTTSITGPVTTPTVLPTTVPGTSTTDPRTETSDPTSVTTIEPSSTSAAATLPGTTEPPTVATTEPEPTTEPPVTTTEPVAPKELTGRDMFYADLALTGGAVNLVSVTDGSTVYLWSAGNGKGIALDPASNVPRPIASMPAAATPSADGMWTWAGGRAFVRSVSTYALYDPTADTWTTAALPEPRSGLSVTVWTGSRVLVWGGLPSTDGTGETPLDGLLLDPTTKQWTRTRKAPSARTGEVSAARAGGAIGIVGDAVGNVDTAPLLLYRPADDSWFEAGPPVALPYTPFVTARGNHLLLIALDHTASAEYDTVTGQWTTATPAAAVNHGRHAHAAASDGERLVYLAGDGTLSLYDGATWGRPTALSNVQFPGGVYDAMWAAGRLVLTLPSTASIGSAGAMTVVVEGADLFGP